PHRRDHATPMKSAKMSSLQKPAAFTGGILLLALWLVVAVAQTPASGDPVRGKQLYYDHGCYGCHGFNGQTGARDLTGTGSPILERAETFIAYLRLRAGLLPLLPSTGMPHYPESSLSDADALHI